MKTQLISLICLAIAFGAFGMSPEEYQTAREPFDAVISREIETEKCANLIEYYQIN